MFVNVSISLSSGETASGSANEIAQQVLTAIGGDPSKDVVNVQINDTGSAGQIAPPPSPSEPPPA
jgi:hypothetical protein